MNMIELTRMTNNQIQKTMLSCLATPIQKVETTGLNTGSGLVNYDLQPAAKLLYPVLTPLRNSTPRVKGGGGNATHWKAVVKVNAGNLSMGVAEGRRNGVISTQTEDAMAKYATLGLENNVTDEAVNQSKGFDDLRALCTKNLLESTMIGEEFVLLAGNASMKLGKTGTPTLAAAATGGTLGANKVVSVICSALTPEGYQMASIGSGLQAKITRTNADGTTDQYGGGVAQKSDAASVTTGTGTANSVTASVTAVKGAVAYAWYWGTAGNEVLGAITTINSVLIAADAAGTQKAADLPAEDCSTNELLLDGYMTQLLQRGGYYKALPTGIAGSGKGLTADNAAGIVEIDEALKWFWDNYKASPDEIHCNAQEIKNITQKIIANGGSPLIRFNFDAEKSDVSTLSAGVVIGSYLNKYTMAGGKSVKIVIHPNMPAGTMMFRTTQIPYPLSNVTNVAEVRYQQDYYQTEWPRRTRAYEYGVYAAEALALYAPFCFGILTNIADA